MVFGGIIMEGRTAKAALCAALGNIIWGFSFLFTKMGLTVAPSRASMSQVFSESLEEVGRGAGAVVPPWGEGRCMCPWVVLEAPAQPLLQVKAGGSLCWPGLYLHLGWGPRAWHSPWGAAFARPGEASWPCRGCWLPPPAASHFLVLEPRCPNH